MSMPDCSDGTAVAVRFGDVVALYQALGADHPPAFQARNRRAGTV